MYYKAVRKNGQDLKSYTINCFSQHWLSEVIYKVNEFVQSYDCSPLMVFDSIENAARFICSDTIPLNVELYSCEIILKETQEYINLFTNSDVWPRGTVFAEKVKLLEKVVFHD